EAVDTLARQGHAVHVVLPEPGPLLSRLGGAASVHFCWHNPWATPDIPKARDRLRWSCYDILAASREIAGVARDVGAQAIVSSTITVGAGAVAARISRAPHVWHLAEYGREDHGFSYRFGHRASIALMQHSTDLFLVNSPALLSHYA